MISILNHGNKGSLYCICWECGCEFSYTERDLMAEEGQTFIECPDCGDRIGLRQSGISPMSTGSFNQMQEMRRGIVKDGHFEEVQE